MTRLRHLLLACALLAAGAAGARADGLAPQATWPPPNPAADSMASHMVWPDHIGVYHFVAPPGYHQPLEPLTFGERETDRCLGCHGLPDFFARDTVSGTVLRLTVNAAAYKASAHGKLACTQCHSQVQGFPHAFGGAPRPHVSCDGDCHATDAKGKPVRHDEQMEEFRAGVHRKGLDGAPGLPACAYCHGDGGDPHAVHPAKAFTRAQKLELCASCHDDRDRMRAAKAAPDAAESYRHGLHYAALRLGEDRAAICQDCHDTHGVRAARDTAATTNAKHLRATCGQKNCHNGPGPGFAATGGDHATMASHAHSLASRVRRFFLLVGGAILLLMALGVLLDLQRPLRAPANLVAPDALRPRLSVAMRLQHALLLTSFTLLALTGLPLRWPDVAWLAAMNRAFGGWEGARAIHRGAGAAMVVLGLVHLAIAFVRLVRARFDVARAWPMLPTPGDVREAWETMLWQLRLRPAPAQHGRHEFRTRIHYLAVLWGVPVMALTGLALWFVEALAERTPGAVFAVASMAHGEEALVAVAITLLWHFYNVHFAPGRGLRLWTLVDGRVTERHRAAVHPREDA